MAKKSTSTVPITSAPRVKTTKRIELSVRSQIVAPAAQPHADRRRKDEARQVKNQLRERD